MGKSKLPIIAGGDGVKGVLRTYPTEFGVSRGDLCSIVSTSSKVKVPGFSALGDYSEPSFVSVLLDYDKIFYAFGDNSYPSSGLSLYIYDYNRGKIATKITTKALVPIAAYRINDNTIRLYCLNSTFKQVQVFNVDISTGTPTIGSSILSFASSSPTYKYFVCDNGFSRMCSLGNNRYILFSELCDDSGGSSVYGAGSEIQCTPIYDDGTTIVKGTPITQDLSSGACNFACCTSSETTALLAPIYMSQSDSTKATLKLIGFVFSEDSNPILTKQEFSVPSTTGIYAKNYGANNMYLLKLQDDNYGLVLLDEYNLCRIIHYSIINNVVSMVGSVTQLTDGKLAVADIVGQQMVIAMCLAGASSTSDTTLNIYVLDMTSEPTVADSTSVSKGAWGRLNAALSVHSTITTLYVSSSIVSKYPNVVKAKLFASVEKNVNCVYANKNAVGNTYGEFKVQE